MAKPLVRLGFVEVGLGLALLALVLRAAQVQLIKGRTYAASAAKQRTERVVLEARRGTLFDRHGTAIALTQETYHAGVAPNELRDPRRDVATIARQLRLDPRDVERAMQRRYAWFAGPFTAQEVQPIRSMRGVHLEPVLRRFYPSQEFARAVIGRIGDDGRGSGGGGGGLERLLDSLLSGTPGAAVVLKDREGREYESPARVISEPVAGNDVVLSLDAELQEIAQRALDDAIDNMQADGGDVVMLDPATGEVLAVASRRADGSMRPSAFTETFEPGSLAKIFAAAALITYDRVGPKERVSGEGGHYRLPDRVITDEHPMAYLTLADAIRVSSNIALVKFSARLEPAEQYGMLRAFGFGAPTGVEFPAESPGRLRAPHEWSRPSAASLAIGYELAVTPIQLAAAYGAIANNGVLLEPTLIREVRSPNGALRYRHHPEPVRRVVTAEVAVKLRELLRGVVEGGGTGERAALANFQLAAKTGTARRVVAGRYAAGQYTASFAALFPADDPQLVVIMKIDNPQKGSYFAAQTAAPVTRSMLEQALAARTVAIDRARLTNVAPAVDRSATALDEPDGVVPYVVSWPYVRDTAVMQPDQRIPDVTGKSLREAARALHRRGLRVVIKGWGVVHHTWPAAGEEAPVGATVTIFAEPPPPSLSR
jgi:cell division protein FtsI (penicillin-binding protein 3)